MSRGKTYEVYSESINSGKYDQGIQALTEVIKENIEIEEALQLRSHLYHLTENFTQAKEDLDRAIAHNPNAKGCYYDRGSLHESTGEYYLALKDFSKAVHFAHQSGDDELIDAAEHHFVAILEKMRST